MSGKRGGGSIHASDESIVVGGGKKKDGELEVGRGVFSNADSQGGAVSARTGKGKERAVDTSDDCGGGKRSGRKERESVMKCSEEREKKQNGGCKTRREDAEVVVQEVRVGEGADSVFERKGEKRTKTAGSQSNEERGVTSSAGQQSTKGLGRIGGGQGGEASAIKQKQRAVNLPTSNPRFKVGDQVLAKSTRISSGGRTEKSGRYFKGIISVALDSNGRYGVDFDDDPSKTDAVKEKLVRHAASAVGGAFKFDCPGCSQVCLLANACT